MIRIAVVEDDINYINTMKKYLKKYEQESNNKFVVTHFLDGEEIVTDYSADYDIILMDIEMQFMNGMKAAEEIRKYDSEVVIIFITNMPQYVMEGYKVDALDYVLKPLTYFALSERIDRAIKRMNRRSRAFITISLKGGMKKLDVSEIKFIEVNNHDCIIHTVYDRIHFRESLKNLEQSLKSDIFFRIHKCYLVNLEYVDSVVSNDVVIGNESIQVSRSKKKSFLDALNDYINEVSK